MGKIAAANANDQNASDQGVLTAPRPPLAFFLDLDPPLADFRTDVVEGLSKPQKSLSPMYLYDERGSALFSDITTLDEYYPTRTEAAIVNANAAAIGEAIGPGRAVFEYGSGASAKIRKLLNLMTEPTGYVATDISRDYLLANAATLAESVDLPVGAVCADFNTAITPPTVGAFKDARWLGYFPGSTLGNLSYDDAVRFLRLADTTLGTDARFLLGIDLEKDADVLKPAYDDHEGVTAAFNKNLLRRIKQELGAELDEDAFEHVALIGDAPQRVEMHLRAKKSTEIVLDGRRFAFAAGETLHTENSNKYSLERLDALLSETPWRRTETFTDPKSWFATCLLSNT
ncbi:MAG: L-histidine N(alpha)-methyltransferase [Pseudomonadota bacterium]